MAKKKGTAYEELVASIVGSFFHENCVVKQGSWVDGPDGRRDMDVLIEGLVKGKNLKVLVECKDYDKSKTGKVGIELIDALDSKRHDLNIDKCLICSNSGFTDPAIRKAKRKNIGVISAIKSGDNRIKIEIIEKIFYQIVKIDTFNCKFHIHKRSEGFEPSNVLYKKLPVYLWIQQRMSYLASNFNNRNNNNQLNKIFRFKQPLQVRSKARKFLLSAVEGNMAVTNSWYSMDVKLDAKSAIYNYLSGQINLTPGKNNFQIHGLGIAGKEGKLEEELPQDSELGVTFNENKSRIAVMMIEGLNFKSDDEIPNLNSLVVDEDMSLEFSKP